MTRPLSRRPSTPGSEPVRLTRGRMQLIDRLESAGQDYIWYLSILSEDEIKTAPGAREWSVHQIAAHMRDVEMNAFLPRIRRILKEEHPFVENFDEAEWNRSHYTPDEPLRKINAAFRTARRNVVRLLRSAAKEDWDNWAVHSAYGKISLDWLLEHDYSHTLDHLAQIGRLREGTLLKQLNGK